jgi:hypothetical protein
MKKLQLLATLLLFSIISFANYNNTRLVISTNDNNIRVVIDGYEVGYRYKNGNLFTINDISSSYHRIQIFKYTTGIFGNSKERLMYDQNVYLKQNFETNMAVNDYGNIRVSEYPIGNGGWNGSNNYPPKNNGCNNGRGRKRGHEKRFERYDDDDRNQNNNRPEERDWKGGN